MQTWLLLLLARQFFLAPTTSKRLLRRLLLSSTSQKISTWKSLARVAAEEQNGPGLWEFAGESGSDLTKIPY